MKKSYATIAAPNKSSIPQTQPLDSRQVKNNAGGYVYAVSHWDQFTRFLIIGSMGGTFYVNEQDLTKQNFSVLQRCLAEDYAQYVNTVVEVSDSGKAVKNAPAIFALALAAATGSVEAKKMALMNLAKVARQSTDFFSFVDQYKALGGGFGTMVRKAISSWYQSKPLDKVAYQMVKYRQRDGWTHHDILHLSHVKPTNKAESNLYGFAKNLASGKGEYDASLLPDTAVGFLRAQAASGTKELVSIINEYSLPREAIPTEYLNDVKVWEALLPSMPAHAMIRNLGKMTQVGLISSLSEGEKLVAQKLGDSEWLRKSRLHPIAVLTALKVYQSATGVRGSLSWNPSRKIIDALDSAFYGCFGNVVPTGKNINLALDVSGSMGMAYQGMILTPREITAAMSLVTAATEENYIINGFSTRFVELDISPKMRLDEVMRKISGLPFAGTDCSLPMLHALEKNIPIDTFVVYTDNETYAGRMHPSQALKDFRKRVNPNAKLVVCATSATNFSIADPNDRGMMDISGFSADVPSVISEFIRG